MRYIHFTEEQKRQANSVDLAEFLRREGEKLRAQGGASLMAVCRAAQEAGLAGLEFAYGIPGQVGGGVYMNAGAYGGELRDVVESVEYLDEAGEPRTLSGEAHDGDYPLRAYSRIVEMA